MFHKIRVVMPQESYQIKVEFQNGTKKLYDVSLLMDKWDVFKTLKTVPGLFGQVKVDAGGFGISWNDEIDLSCDEIWENGKEIKQ